MRVGVLGPVEACLDHGDPGQGSMELGSPKQRALLAALALHRGRPVSPDQLVDLLWADSPPPGAAQTLQSYVAGLRRVLEPDRAPRAAARVLVTEAPGYALHLPTGALDVDLFEATVGRVHRRLAAAAPTPAVSGASGQGSTNAPTLAAPPVAEAEPAVADLEQALGLWRATPYLELGDAPAAVAERVRLEELRMVALEDRAVAGLALGRHATVAAELEALTLQHPLRERLWALRAVALARSGRQADALDVLARVRAVLVEELGIEPGPELRAVQAAVLRQDPAMTWTPPPAAVPAAGPGRPGSPYDAASPTTAGTVATGNGGPVRGRDPVLPTPWPLVGRDRELAALVALLDTAETGTPAFAALVGDPGIGKSRLLAELAGVARRRGGVVLVGRCSQDEGAPPLWPWTGVLNGLGRDLPTNLGDTDEGSRFRVWDEIVRAVREASADTTVLLVLEDLHWADTSSLRVLGLLLESVHEGRLVVAGSWRADPPPSGGLAAVAEQLSRRHALRLHLHGLRAAEVGEIVAAVAPAPPSAEEADALRTRTEGNPFFVLEYARLVRDDCDLARLLAEPTPPHGVTDVVRRRLERLPEPARAALVPAAVLGRHFELGHLAKVLDWDEDRVLDALDVAAAAGLVREDGVDRFRFSHALVCDTVEAGLSSTRRARWHARVAEVLADAPGRAGEVARHWRAAGPAYVDRAWRASREAAREALGVCAYDEAVDLLSNALVTLAEDPGANVTDEYDLLVELGLSDKACGDWVNLRPVVHRAVAVAERLDDPVAVARVAVMPSIDALWQSTYHGEVDTVLVQALHRSLEALPAADSELRCRVLLALAAEQYYGVSPEERESLAEEALAMARRLGDPSLLMSTCQNAFVVIWRPGTAERREALAEEALRLARELGDRRGLLNAATLRAVVAAERGDVELFEALAAEARTVAEEQRNLYALVVLDSLEVGWCAMRGRFDEAQERLGHLQSCGDRMGLSQQTDAVRGALLAILLWQESYAPVLEVLHAADADEALPLDAAVLALLGRLGRLEEARALRAGGVDLGGDTWFSLLPWALAADAARSLDDSDLARTAYRLLAPHAGHLACAGSGVALGPVDMYLALAASTTGDTELAARHADTALELCRAWQVPLVADWFARQRDRYAF